MPLLNNALTLYLGSSPVQRVYAGLTQVYGEGDGIEALFAAGEIGMWCDITKAPNLFQDSAGVVPVTSLGQPVGFVTDLSGNGNHASQPVGAARPTLPLNGYMLRSDFVDDHINVALPQDCEMWVNTTLAHYRTIGNAGVMHLPLSNVTHIVARDALTAPQRLTIAAYFRTPYAAGGIFLSPSTTVSMLLFAVTGSPPTTVRFAGSNGVEVTKVWENANSVLSVDLSVDGLTAPVMIIPSSPGCVGIRITDSNLAGDVNTSGYPDATDIYFYNNRLTGCVDLSNNLALKDVRLQTNRITGFRGSVNPSLGRIYLHENNLTQESVDRAISACLSAGRTSASGICQLRLNGGGNAAPSAQGLASKAQLEARGWTVTVN